MYLATVAIIYKLVKSPSLREADQLVITSVVEELKPEISVLKFYQVVRTGIEPMILDSKADHSAILAPMKRKANLFHSIGPSLFVQVRQ